MDGDRIKSDNEPPVSNVLVNIEKDRTISSERSYIPEVELLSDVNGEISFENLPKDNYKLTFNPLVNLKSLYFLNGAEQKYYNDKSRVLYVPLAESYKIMGRIILVRDPNSSEGKIDMSGVRITATGPKGETYSVLTDNFGAFLLNVPNAEKFKVQVNNVFGEQFSIDADEVEVQFVQNKTINLDFIFIEKRRTINFGDGSEMFNFNSITNQITEHEVAQKPETTTTSPVAETKSYSIQLDALKTYREPTFYKNKFNLKEDVYVAENNGEFKYYTGNYKTIEDAKNAKNKLKLTGFPVAVDPSTLKKSIAIDSKQPVASQPKTDPTTTKQPIATVQTKTEQPTANSPVTQNQTSTVVEPTTQKPLPTTPTVSQTQKTVPVTSKTESTQSAVITQNQQNGNTAIVANQSKSETGQSYAIQMDVLKTYRDPSYYKEKFNLKTDVFYTENNGEYKYYTGDYSSMDEARSDIARNGINGFPVAVDRPTLIKAEPTQQSYAIQLDALRTYRDPTFYNDKFKLKDEILYTEKDGEYKYYFGNYQSIDAAKTDMNRLRISGFPVAIDRTLVKKEFCGIKCKVMQSKSKFRMYTLNPMIYKKVITYLTT